LKVGGFIVSREGRHYSKRDRVKMLYEDDSNLFKILQEEDDLANTFKLFGPFEKEERVRYPACSFIEVVSPEEEYYYQQKTSVPYLVMLLEHYFRFEPHHMRDNIVDNIQNRAYNFIKML